MVSCKLCGREWDTDPALQVGCPACGATPGQRCKRPSGYTLPFGEVHRARDLRAAQEIEGYGFCPASVTEPAQLALPLHD